VAAHLVRWPLITQSAGAAFNIALNLFLIPRWGAHGGAATTVATECLALGIQMWAFRRHVGSLRPGRDIVGPIAVTLGASMVLVTISWVYQAYWLACIASLIWFGLGFWLCRPLPESKRWLEMGQVRVRAVAVKFRGSLHKVAIKHDSA